MSKKYLYHTHHIVPKHAGGTDDPSNLIKLTVEEHALAHKKLFFIYGRWQDELAYKGLSNMMTREEIIMQLQKNNKEQRKAISQRMMGNTINVGRKYTQARKDNIGKANKGKIRTAETKRKLSISHLGNKQSDASRKKISETLKGIKRSPETRRRMSEAKKLYWANKN